MKNYEITLLKKANEFKGWDAHSRFLSESNKDTATVVKNKGEYAILHSIGYSVYLGIFANMVKVINGEVQQDSEVVGLLDVLTEDDYVLLYEMMEELALVPIGTCLEDEETLHEFFGGYSASTTEHCSNQQIAKRKERMFTPIASEEELNHLFGGINRGDSPLEMRYKKWGRREKTFYSTIY